MSQKRLCVRKNCTHCDDNDQWYTGFMYKAISSSIIMYCTVLYYTVFYSVVLMYIYLTVALVCAVPNSVITTKGDSASFRHNKTLKHLIINPSCIKVSVWRTVWINLGRMETLGLKEVMNESFIPTIYASLIINLTLVAANTLCTIYA